MDQSKLFSELDQQTKDLRMLILKHAKEQDVSDEHFLIELHQLTHRILTLKRMIRNGKARNDDVYKNCLGYCSTAN